VEVPVDANVKYKKEVTCIKWKNLPEAKVMVECSDGSSYTADHAIVTVSLGVLKDKAQSLFSPALPPQKLNVIKVRWQTIGVCCYIDVAECLCLLGCYAVLLGCFLAFRRTTGPSFSGTFSLFLHCLILNEGPVFPCSVRDYRDCTPKTQWPIPEDLNLCYCDWIPSGDRTQIL
jgi:Monoamine oxidase